MNKHIVYKVDVKTEKRLLHGSEFRAWLKGNGVEPNDTVSIEYTPTLNRITAYQYIRDSGGKFFICHGCEAEHQEDHAAVTVKSYSVEFKPEQLILDDLEELMDRIGYGDERPVRTES